VFAVGSEGTILHYDGMDWSQVPTGLSAGFVDVWGSAANEVIAVAQDGTTLHYDGEAWTALPSPPTLYSPSAIWGTGVDDLFVAIHDENALYFDGTVWTLIETPASQPIRLIWGTGKTVFLVEWEQPDLVLYRNYFCAQKESFCSGNEDDDCDGKVDCADPDCAAQPSCQ
jgi:hypothetical protein